MVRWDDNHFWCGFRQPNVKKPLSTTFFEWAILKNSSPTLVMLAWQHFVNMMSHLPHGFEYKFQ